MKDKFKKLFEQEVDKFIDETSISDLIGILTEDRKIIHSLEKSFDDYYNKDNQITPELWNYFIDSVGKLIELEEFQEKCKQINCKLYAVKQFSKIKLVIADSTEDTLKFELKKYFPQLAVGTSKEFMEVFFSLPFEFISLVVRYIVNVKFSKMKNSLTPQLEDAKVYFSDLEKKKNRFIININKLSKGQSNTFSLGDLKELLDTKAFYDYNPLNVGALEYIMRIFTNPKSKKKLADEFTPHYIAYMESQVLVHPSYIKFLEGFQNETEQPYFLKNGLQNKEREETFDDFVMQYYFPDQYIPTAKEEPVEVPIEPLPEPKTPQSEQPTQEELLNQPPTPEIPK